MAGKATVTPPAAGRPWKEYELVLCVKGASPPSCRTLSPLCTAAADAAAATECAIPGCKSATTYTVEATALLADGTRSPQSAPADFTTPKYPAPAVHTEATSPHSGKAEVTEPTVGGPWAKYELSVCPTAGPATACLQRECAYTQSITTCLIGEPTGELLTEKTDYSVTVVAVAADGGKSLPGSSTFATPSQT